MSRTRKYNVDDNFFKKINNEYNAYILGFIYADGCVHSKRNTFSITLQESDKNILSKIKYFMKSDNPISFHKSRYDEKNKYTEKCNLSITSKKIIQDLKSFGCVDNKSNILVFPKINNKYIHHFMRGYFDGDGSVFVTNQNDIRFGIVSTKEFCEEYLNLLPYDGKSKIKKEYRSNKNVYYISIGGKYNISKIYQYLYNGSSIYLNRKKQVFEKFFLNNEIIEKEFCTICLNNNTKKNGYTKNKLRYYCKDCNKNFYKENLYHKIEVLKV